MKRLPPATEAQILSEVIAPERGDLEPAAAESILAFQFSRSAASRIRTLLRANNQGKLSPLERMELERYLRVGQLLDLLQAKARQALARHQAA